MDPSTEKDLLPLLAPRAEDNAATANDASAQMLPKLGCPTTDAADAEAAAEAIGRGGQVEMKLPGSRALSQSTPVDDNANSRWKPHGGEQNAEGGNVLRGHGLWEERLSAWYTRGKGHAGHVGNSRPFRRKEPWAAATAAAAAVTAVISAILALTSPEAGTTEFTAGGPLRRVHRPIAVNGVEAGNAGDGGTATVQVGAGNQSEVSGHWAEGAG